MDFPPAARVRKRREYLRFFHQSQVKRLDSCLIFKIPSPEPQARLGITVKSRTNSVMRNKIKRQVRELFRQNRDKLKPFDYNVVVPGHVKVTYRTSDLVRKNLESIWSNETIF